ncbi:MAG: T9SS type A sorting domain-containing protein [Victivallaceae bacterium]|nr:T9SS type A sorting domain-containing protein [Victivallaceae bacterium]
MINRNATIVYNTWKLTLINIFIFMLVNSIVIPASQGKSLTKPTKLAQERYARKQPAEPDQKIWQNLLFVETNKVPPLTKVEKRRGYMLFQRPAAAIVYPTTVPKAYERLIDLQGFATPGEFEPLTFSIYPTQKLIDLRVTVSNLKNGNAIIKDSAIDIRLETSWNVRYPKYNSKNSYRRIPELLEKVTIHSSDAGESLRYWLILQVPANTQAGIYRGQVTLTTKGSQAVSIPIKFRVLDFKLKRDPKKHYTAYYYDIYLNNVRKTVKDKEKWLKNAVKADYKAMVDFGFDTLPTIYPRYNTKTGEVYIENDGITLDRAMQAGMGNAVPITMGHIIGPLYNKYTKARRASHWRITKMPPPAFYRELTQLVKTLEQERKKRGWPEFIYCPLDEVSPSAIEFGIKTYKAVKDAGVKVYITKHPTAVDAQKYAPYVDIFCSQPFSASYEKTQKSKHEYWSYPNHNSGETKIPRVRTLGGRMTYGYGFWRSGYTTLIPWIWRWDSKAFTPFDYLANKKSSPAGNMLDENGDLIPTPYWICFREGYDDARYIYTLESAIFNRIGSRNSQCRKLLQQGTELLNYIWNHIPVQPVYKVAGIWPDNEFNALRWEMAELITGLNKFPATNSNVAPSVLPSIKTDKTAAAKKIDIVAREIKKGNVTVLDLGDETVAKWRSVAKESTLTLVDAPVYHGKKSLKFQIKIDHKVDGGNEKGKYPIGWPRMAYTFPRHSLDLTEYDYLSMWIMVDSDRDEVADDFTTAYFNISSWNKDAPRQIFNARNILGNIEQKEWIAVNISISDMLAKGSGIAPFKNIKRMQFGIGESQYSDGTSLTFFLDRIALLKIKRPVFKSLYVQNTLLLPTKQLIVTAEVIGRVDSVKQKITTQIINSVGKVVIKQTNSLRNSNVILLDVTKLIPGTYKLKLKTSSGATISQQFKAIAGPI